LLIFCHFRPGFGKKIAKLKRFAKILANLTTVLAKFWQKHSTKRMDGIKNPSGRDPSEGAVCIGFVNQFTA
jgi:hypothetical protein